jgi:hypothetical protein
MATKLLLEYAGDRAVMTVSECKSVQTKFGTKLVFTGMTDEGEQVETPLIPDTTALKQLDRIGLLADTVLGERLEFSRAANPSGKPYWNIDPARAGQAPAPKRMPAPGATVAPAAAATPTADKTPDQRRDALISQYLMLWKTVATHLDDVKNVVIDASVVQAATATIWISLKDHGLQVTQPVVKAAPAPAIPTTPPASGKRLTPQVSVPPENPADDDLPF